MLENVHFIYLFRMSRTAGLSWPWMQIFAPSKCMNETKQKGFRRYIKNWCGYCRRGVIAEVKSCKSKRDWMDPNGRIQLCDPFSTCSWNDLPSQDHFLCCFTAFNCSVWFDVPFVIHLFSGSLFLVSCTKHWVYMYMLCCILKAGC